MKSFLKALLSSTGEASSKRFVVVILSLFCCAVSFVLLWVLVLILVKAIPVSQANANQFFDLFDNVVLYSFGTMWIGLGFITASDFITVLTRKFDAKIVQAQTGTPDVLVKQTIDTQNVTSDKPIDTQTVETSQSK